MYVFIYSSMRLKDSRQALEDDIDELLSGVGEVTGGGSGINGWNIDIEINNKAEFEKHVERLKKFLREWPVPNDTYLDVNGHREEIL